MQRFLLITFVLTFSTFLKAQGVTNPEDDVYVKLVEQFYQSDIIEDKIVISDSILRLSKKSLDTLHIVAGYYLKAEIFEDDRVIQYSDSLITILEGKPTYWQPASAYVLRGNYFYRNNKYNKSLNQFILSHKFNLEQNNQTLQNYTDYYIGILKIRLEEYEDAKDILLSNLNEIKKAEGEILVSTKHSHWFGIAYSYSKLGNIDSSNYYVNMGLQETLMDTTGKAKGNFLLVRGVNSYLKMDYKIAVDQLTKAKIELKESSNGPNLAAAFYYNGLARLKKTSDPKWIEEFKSMDSIIRNPDYILPQLRPAYEHLIKFYEEKKNDSLALYNIKRLITFDSVNSTRNMQLSRNISEGYDLPKLIQKRNNIIKSLNNKAIVSNVLLWVSGFLIVILLIIAINLNRLKKRNDLRYKKIIDESKSGIENQIIEQTHTKYRAGKSKSKINISNEVRLSILEELRAFEQRKEYLEKDLTLTKLAKKFKHNSRYISIIVNDAHNTPFTHYINNLRIKHTIEKLQNDEVFIKYTLKAIAYEVGFKQVESFNKAFFRVAGIKPLYFIKRLHLERNELS